MRIFVPLQKITDDIGFIAHVNQCPSSAGKTKSSTCLRQCSSSSVDCSRQPSEISRTRPTVVDHAAWFSTSSKICGISDAIRHPGATSNDAVFWWIDSRNCYIPISQPACTWLRMRARERTY